MLYNTRQRVDIPAGAAVVGISVCDGPVLTNHFFRLAIKPESYLTVSPEMVDFGFGQGRSDVETEGVAGLRQ
jgi:hypothetical protein